MCNIILIFVYKLFSLTLTTGFVYHECKVTGNTGSHGVMVSTLDFESSDPSSNLGGTSKILFSFLEIEFSKYFFLIFCKFKFISQSVKKITMTSYEYTQKTFHLRIRYNKLGKYEELKSVLTSIIIERSQYYKCTVALMFAITSIQATTRYLQFMQRYLGNIFRILMSMKIHSSYMY